MEIRQLKYFAAIVDAGSLTKAAEMLYVAQPSLSQQMAGLEAELKVKLLIRSPQGVRPTEAGKILYHRARSMISQIDQIRTEVAEGHGSASGPVSVGFPTTAAALLSLPLYQRVRANYPGIRLKVVESMSGYLTELLANGRLDMAMLYRDTETRGVSVHPVFDEDLYLIGHCGSSADGAVDMRHLEGMPLVMPSPTHGLRILVERSFARLGVAPDFVADIDSLPALLSFAASGAACTILPVSVLALPGEAARATANLLREPGIRRPISICRPTTLPLSAAAIAVRQVMLELIDELVEQGRWQGVTLREERHATGD